MTSSCLICEGEMKNSIAILIMTAFTSTVAFAGIHQWTDANGTVHFSDTPPVNQANVKEIEVREGNVAKGSEMHVNTSRSYSSRSSSDINPVLSVTSPTNNEIIRENAGNVVISGQAQNVPMGYKIELKLDGKTVATGGTNLSVRLENVDRGTHTVTMEASGNGKTFSSNPVSFTLQRFHK